MRKVAKFGAQTKHDWESRVNPNSRGQKQVAGAVPDSSIHSRASMQQRTLNMIGRKKTSSQPIRQTQIQDRLQAMIVLELREDGYV